MKPVILIIVAILFFSTNRESNAQCWQDKNLTELTMELARNGFHRSSLNFPLVQVCSGQYFRPGIGGQYVGSAEPRIQIPDWQLNSPNLRQVLAHELAHSENALGNGSMENDGHSVGFFIALMRSGWFSEVNRLAETMPQAQQSISIASSVLYVGERSQVLPAQTPAIPEYSTSLPEYVAPKPGYTTITPECPTVRSEYTTVRPGYTTVRPGYTTVRPGNTTEW